jgi:hypothetical protein
MLDSVTPAPFDNMTMLSLDDCYGFAEKLWSTNRDFLISMLDIASDLGKSFAPRA